MALENFPAELIRIIVQHLDIADVGNLRQTNQCLHSKVTQPYFTTYFHSKRIHMTGAALENLAILTQPGRLGCEIRNLTLVGVANDTEGLEELLNAKWKNYDQKKRSSMKRDLETLQQRRQEYQQLVQSGEIVQYLAKAFQNIAANGVNRKLQSLSLEVIVYRGDHEQAIPPVTGGSWRLIWQAAAEAFHLTFTALRETNLEVNSLNIFNTCQRCSIASNELSNIDYRDERLSRTLGSLESLSISVSDRIIDITSRKESPSRHRAGQSHERTREINEAMVEAQDEENFTGLAHLLQCCRQLKRLEIHQYRVSRRRIEQIRMPKQRLFQRIAELNRLPNLVSCSLRGVFFREQDLLSFLKRVDLRQLSMENVHMTTGTFSSIFDYCTSETSRMDSLYAARLMMNSDVLHFDGVADPDIMTGGAVRTRSTLMREGQEIKLPIAYDLISGGFPMVDSPYTRQLRLQHQRDFGPP